MLPLVPANKCPSCDVEVNPAARVCPACKAELALCGWCRDLTTLRQVEPRGRFRRDRYSCDRCGRPGVKCRTWLLGGYCNGLARASARFAHPLCASCTEHVMSGARTVAAWTVIGLVGGRLKPKR